MSNRLWRRKHSYNLVIPLVVGFMFMALSGPVGAIKSYSEAQLKAGKGGFKRLTDKEIGHLATNRTFKFHQIKATQACLHCVHYQTPMLQEVEVGLQVVSVPTLKVAFVLHPMHRTTHQVRPPFLLRPGTSTLAAWP